MRGKETYSRVRKRRTTFEGLLRIDLIKVTNSMATKETYKRDQQYATKETYSRVRKRRTTFEKSLNYRP